MATVGGTVGVGTGEGVGCGVEVGSDSGVGITAGSEVGLGPGVRVARVRLGVQVAVWVHVTGTCGTGDRVGSGVRSMAGELGLADAVGERSTVGGCAPGSLVGGLSQDGRTVPARSNAPAIQATALVLLHRIRVCTVRTGVWRHEPPLICTSDTVSGFAQDACRMQVSFQGCAFPSGCPLRISVAAAVHVVCTKSPPLHIWLTIPFFVVYTVLLPLYDGSGCQACPPGRRLCAPVSIA